MHEERPACDSVVGPAMSDSERHSKNELLVCGTGPEYIIT